MSPNSQKVSLFLKKSWNSQSDHLAKDCEKSQDGKSSDSYRRKKSTQKLFWAIQQLLITRKMLTRKTKRTSFNLSPHFNFLLLNFIIINCQNELILIRRSVQNLWRKVNCKSKFSRAIKIYCARRRKCHNRRRKCAKSSQKERTSVEWTFTILVRLLFNISIY